MVTRLDNSGCSWVKQKQNLRINEFKISFENKNTFFFFKF